MESLLNINPILLAFLATLFTYLMNLLGSLTVVFFNNISKRVLSDYNKLIEKVCNSDMANVYVLPQVHTLIWGNKQGV